MCKGDVCWCAIICAFLFVCLYVCKYAHLCVHWCIQRYEYMCIIILIMRVCASLPSMCLCSYVRRAQLISETAAVCPTSFMMLANICPAPGTVAATYVKRQCVHQNQKKHVQLRSWILCFLIVRRFVFAKPNTCLNGCSLVWALRAPSACLSLTPLSDLQKFVCNVGFIARIQMNVHMFMHIRKNKHISYIHTHIHVYIFVQIHLLHEPHIHYEYVHA